MSENNFFNDIGGLSEVKYENTRISSPKQKFGQHCFLLLEFKTDTHTFVNKKVMAATSSVMVSLGTPAPMFTLTDVVSGNAVSLPHQKDAVATVIMFICNHCPYVKHINAALVRLATDYLPRGISFMAISSNDTTKYPEDGPEKMKALALHHKYPFPYLYDETQQVARAFDAACTPDFFVYDKNLKLVYRGQFDDSRPGNTIPVTGNDLRQAIDCVVANKPVSDQQKPSIGCNIKWKQ